MNEEISRLLQLMTEEQLNTRKMLRLVLAELDTVKAQVSSATGYLITASHRSGHIGTDAAFAENLRLVHLQLARANTAEFLYMHDLGEAPPDADGIKAPAG